MPAELPAGRYLPAGPVSGSCPRPGSGHPRPSVPSLRGTSRRRRRPEAAFLRTERKRDSLTDRCPENRKQRCRAPAALPPHPGLPEALPVPLPGGGAARGPPKHGRGNPGPQNPSPPRGHHLPFHRREPEAPGLCRAPGLYPRPGAPARPGIGGHTRGAQRPSRPRRDSHGTRPRGPRPPRLRGKLRKSQREPEGRGGRQGGREPGSGLRARRAPRTCPGAERRQQVAEGAAQFARCPEPPGRSAGSLREPGEGPLDRPGPERSRSTVRCSRPRPHPSHCPPPPPRTTKPPTRMRRGSGPVPPAPPVPPVPGPALT